MLEDRHGPVQSHMYSTRAEASLRHIASARGSIRAATRSNRLMPSGARGLP
jgi:hypothetical protein